MRKILCLLMLALIGLCTSAAMAQSPPVGTPAQLDSQADIAALRKAADAGDSAAQANLGAAYYVGIGVPQNYLEAAKWLRRGADQGDADAQCLLAMSYQEGQGVPQDYVLAYMWSNLATSHSSGDDRTRYSGVRDAVAARMTTAQIAEAQTLARNWEPKGREAQTVANAPANPSNVSRTAAAQPSTNALPQNTKASNKNDTKQWQQAIVTDISDGLVYVGSTVNSTNPIGGTSAQYRDVWVVTIATKDTVYVARGNCGKIFDAPCRSFAVNGAVQIAVGVPASSLMDRIEATKGDLIYIKDGSGKEFRMTIAKKALKP